MKLSDIPVLSVPVVCLLHFVRSCLWKIGKFRKLNVTEPRIHIKRQKKFKKKSKHVRKQGRQPVDVTINMPSCDKVTKIKILHPHIQDPRQNPHVIIDMPDYNQVDIPSIPEDIMEPKVSWLQQTWQYTTSRLRWPNFISNMWAAAWYMINQTVTSMVISSNMLAFYAQSQLQSITSGAGDTRCPSPSDDLEFYDALEEGTLEVTLQSNLNPP
ncbi:uncharacterized protein LOC142662742 [Rhinoderma darwinii]|uniref:uncharacterized protein LOC142662742 n=1 Tax=Rhinoderma darwinii TaxID=43563 RepID=UPI003F6728A5